MGTHLLSPGTDAALPCSTFLITKTKPFSSLPSSSAHQSGEKLVFLPTAVHQGLLLGSYMQDPLTICVKPVAIRGSYSLVDAAVALILTKPVIPVWIFF